MTFESKLQALVAELKPLLEKATPRPWRTGREDMQSYDGETGKPFRSIYCDDERAEMHLGERLPFVVARLFGEDEKDLGVDKANAALIVAAVNAVSQLEALLAERQEPPLAEAVAWLIERGGLCLGFCDRKFSWITFTNESALRFSRRSDAIRFIEAMRGDIDLNDVLVTEHMWNAAAQPSSGTGERK